MNSILRGVLAVIGGIVLGSVVNMGVLTLGAGLFPIPEGIDPYDLNDLREKLHLLSPMNVLTPICAHAIGTLVGAYIAARIVIGNKMRVAFTVGGIFLIFGIINLINIPTPVWGIILDLVLAYIPMSWIGGSLASK